ncbi:DUF4168 domain-containing protein [Marinobacter sp.]|uniref:DUF4168 domain-containing protein n=1 Tax=Marinobacter sp. TaxID=50741 RepID=UPI0019F35295|nr:DUF4168 domain-containing protein [Marinobacter sp.]MBE0485043.1 DUF4168 domain-containing protein [Marinobacter sp.]
MNKLLISVTASLALLAAAPAMAQQSSQQDAAASQGSGYADPAAGAQSADYNDAELNQFVEAQNGVMEVREDYIAKIEAADSQQEAQELQMEANDHMVSVIEDAGMDIPTYNAIATAYSSDPEVRNRIDALM